MDIKETIDRLTKLTQLDIDAVQAYEQAIERVDATDIRMNLGSFKADHERHISELSQAIRELGGEPPERSPDVKGVLLEGFTALRSVTGIEGALKAMRTNEKLTNKSYEDALKMDLAPAVQELVRRNREDERRHLEYIEHALDNRIWEPQRGAEPTPPAG
jgi:uncharacterized protein (TIGR02284 family)